MSAMPIEKARTEKTMPGIAKLVTMQKNGERNIRKHKLQSYKHRKQLMPETKAKQKLKHASDCKSIVKKPPLLSLLSGDLNEDKKEEMAKEQFMYGKCNHVGCKCCKFVESTSKWSRGKCKYCNHKKEHHKKIKIKTKSLPK